MSSLQPMPFTGRLSREISCGLGHDKSFMDYVSVLGYEW